MAPVVAILLILILLVGTSYVEKTTKSSQPVGPLRNQKCKVISYDKEMPYILNDGVGSGENFPDPAKKVRIEPDPDPKPYIFFKWYNLNFKIY